MDYVKEVESVDFVSSCVRSTVTGTQLAFGDSPSSENSATVIVESVI